MRSVVAFGAVVAVADVVNGDVIAIDFRPGGLGHVGLPGPVVRRLQSKPPGQHQGESREANLRSLSRARGRSAGAHHGDAVGLKRQQFEDKLPGTRSKYNAAAAQAVSNRASSSRESASHEIRDSPP